MANFLIPVGVQSACFVGSILPSSSAPPLTKIKATRTAGIEIEHVVPRAYVESKGGRLQSGLQTVTLSMSFLAEDDLVWKLAKGLDLDDDINDPPKIGTHYSILLLYVDRRAKKSYWFPDLEIDGPIGVNYNKDRTTVIPLKFVGTSRSLSEELIVRDNYPNMLETWKYPELKNRSPI